MNLEKLEKKLQEAKTIEEKRLLQEALLSYVEYLRELLGRRETTVFTVYIMSLVSMPLQLLSHITVLVYALPCLVLLVFLYIRKMRIEIRQLEKEIYAIYELILDPPMPKRENGRSSMCDIIYWSTLALVIMSIIIAILKTIL